MQVRILGTVEPSRDVAWHRPVCRLTALINASCGLAWLEMRWGLAPRLGPQFLSTPQVFEQPKTMVIDFVRWGSFLLGHGPRGSQVQRSVQASVDEILVVVGRAGLGPAGAAFAAVGAHPFCGGLPALGFFRGCRDGHAVVSVLAADGFRLGSTDFQAYPRWAGV